MYVLCVLLCHGIGFFVVVALTSCFCGVVVAWCCCCCSCSCFSGVVSLLTPVLILVSSPSFCGTLVLVSVCGAGCGVHFFVLLPPIHCHAQGLKEDFEAADFFKMTAFTEAGEFIEGNVQLPTAETQFRPPCPLAVCC